MCVITLILENSTVSRLETGGCHPCTHLSPWESVTGTVYVDMNMQDIHTPKNNNMHDIKCCPKSIYFNVAKHLNFTVYFSNIIKVSCKRFQYHQL